MNPSTTGNAGNLGDAGVLALLQSLYGQGTGSTVPPNAATIALNSGNNSVSGQDATLSGTGSLNPNQIPGNSGPTTPNPIAKAWGSQFPYAPQSGTGESTPVYYNPATGGSNPSQGGVVGWNGGGGQNDSAFVAAMMKQLQQNQSQYNVAPIPNPGSQANANLGWNQSPQATTAAINQYGGPLQASSGTGIPANSLPSQTIVSPSTVNGGNSTAQPAVSSGGYPSAPVSTAMPSGITGVSGYMPSSTASATDSVAASGGQGYVPQSNAAAQVGPSVVPDGSGGYTTDPNAIAQNQPTSDVSGGAAAGGAGMSAGAAGGVISGIQGIGKGIGQMFQGIQLQPIQYGSLPKLTFQAPTMT